MEEIFRPVVGHEEHYIVSNLGRVMSDIKGHGFVEI